MLVDVVIRRTFFAGLVLVLLLSAAATVFAQTELVGTWAARNTEEIGRAHV